MIEICQDQCCDKLNYYQNHKNEFICYDEHTRSYRFIVNDDMYLPLYCCPWCATRLPEDLGELWCQAITNELGIDGT